MILTEKIDQEINHLNEALKNHRLYNSLSSIDDVKIFTHYHVFAVWDFMSLLKSLQNSLTCTSIPWLPNSNSNTARFINEIVLGEETDENENGVFKSHFDMYLDAMQEIGADTTQINSFIGLLRKGIDPIYALRDLQVDEVVVDFVKFTFDIISTGKDHLIASVFTYGREGLIADMFIEILNHSSHINKVSYNSMIYYLQRHIDLDGDEHGPMSMKMIEELCVGQEQKIIEVITVAKKAFSEGLTNMAIPQNIEHSLHEIIYDPVYPDYI